MHKRIDWTDLQFVVALAGSGSLAAAARALGVSHTTVLRRVAALEESQGVRLFDRLRSGYALTAGGEEILAAAQSMANVVNDLERRLAGQDLRLEGVVRIATVDTLLASVLPPILAAFHLAHPAVTMELSASASLANLTRREADIAIRVSGAPPEHLVGRRICSVGLAIYGARSVQRGPLGQPDWMSRNWVGPSDALADTSVATWMRDHLAGAEVVLRADSIMGMAHAAEAGIGLAPLPCYLGDFMPGLQRVSSGPIALERPAHLWVLTHDDMRGSARIRAITQHLGNELSLARGAITGDALR